MIEADFQRFYRLDLRDQVEREGCRRLWALLDGLPPESALGRHVIAAAAKPGAVAGSQDRAVRRMSIRQLAEQVNEGRLN